MTFGVQITTGKVLENDLPVYILTFNTQEVLLFRNAKTREIMVGAENKVEQCTYVTVITRVEEELGNELTGGWKIIEVSISYQHSCDRGVLTALHRWHGGAPELTYSIIVLLHYLLIVVIHICTYHVTTTPHAIDFNIYIVLCRALCLSTSVRNMSILFLA